MAHTLGPGADAPKIINVIVEIPKGSQNKYEFDEEHHIMKLDRVLFSPVIYPGDYGFVPGTSGKDGDPLDAIVLVTYPTYPGTLIEARPICTLEMIDSGVSDDKILCVPVSDVRFNEAKSIGDLGEHVRKEVAHFFEIYKQLEGKHVETRGWKDLAETHRIIAEGIASARK